MLLPRFSKQGITILLLGGLLSGVAMAQQTPRSLASDPRIKIVPYDANNIVTLHGNHLVATAITLNQQEQIISIDTGDKLAWDISVNKKIPFRFTVKPILPTSLTNLTVTTTKHTYLFQLMATPMDTAANATYALSFTYPTEEKALLSENLTEFGRIFPGNDQQELIPLNLNYSFVGSHFLAPVQAGDNGTFTVLKFTKNHPIPAIFGVDAQGNEALLNYRTQGDKVFIQGVRHQYTLRNGEEVTTIYNDDMKA